MKLKKIMALTLSVAMIAGALTGCGTKKDNQGGDQGNTTQESTTTENKTDDKKAADQIYFLNFKPEIAPIYDKIAADYEKETGVKVKVVTAASGTYETTLKSEIAKKEAPTIFQINGSVGFQSWKDYCADLKDTELYSHLTDKSIAVTEGEGVYGIPYAVEGYGIIYNKEIMDKYFALSNKAVSIASTDEIKDFNTLKSVVEDMTAKKADLGIDGVFATTSLGAGEQWRWQTHLANLPLYYEFKDNTAFESTILAGLDSKEITFKYGNNYKNVFDLYLNNSSSEKGLLGSKSVADSMADFALGKVAMVQNGNWAWTQINEVKGNVVKAENVKFMPIYTGMPDDNTQGLCVGTENYFAINSKVDEGKQKASIDFLNWLFSSETGKNYVAKDLGFIAPFDTFTDEQKPADPLSKEVLAWMEKDVTAVPWTFAAFPSEDFKNYFGDALLEYAQGGIKWEEVTQVVIDSWKSEKAK